MIKQLIFSGLLLISSGALGQQLPQYTQWSWNQLSVNPAHAGIKQCIDIHSSYRLQWVGFDGAPNSGFLTLGIPIHARRKQFLSARHGVGLKFETDQIGNFATNRINLAYAAHFNFNQDDRLSLGIYGGVLQTGYDPTQVTTINPDPAVAQQSSFLSPDASFGAWYNSENYFVALTLQNLIRPRWKDIGVDARYRFHTALTAGYRLAINDVFTLLPRLQVKVPPKGPAAGDLNLFLDYQNRFQFGLGYRNTDALMVLFQVNIQQQFFIGYSFDYTLSRIQQGAKNTHEISLRFTSCKQRNTSTSACPLF